MSTPAIQGVRNAKLPTVYIEAQKALATCQKIDECKQWADKAAAIASYAKQAQDQTLMDTATRIKARAIRRCGELLKQIESQSSANLKQNRQDGTVPSRTKSQQERINRVLDLLRGGEITRGDSNARIAKIDPLWASRSRTNAANAAGLSERQRKDALRVASIPADEFEAAIESDSPPTLTELSEAGKREAANREYLTSPKPPGFKHATALLGTLRDFTEFCNKADAALVAEALSKREAKSVLRDMETITKWLKSLKRRMG